MIRADVGQFWSDAIIAVDPDGDEVSVRILETPVGFFPTTNASGLITGFEWTPPEAGQWTVDVVATDSEGNTTLQQIELVARHPRDDDLLLAMGDSVAAGFGRDRTDYLGPDGCWRSEGSAYPGLVFERLVELGTLSDSADFVMVACSGSNGRALLDRPVQATTANGSTRSGQFTQVEWAVEQNPTIITLTIGAQDVQLVDPREVLLDDAGNDPEAAVNEVELQSRLDDLSSSLRESLRTIFSKTDAHVAITTYYLPTAIDPVGVDGCGSECFRIATAEINERLNATILEVAERQPEGRITIVRLDDLFDGHEATNGFGPDLLREANFGPFQGLVSQFTRNTFPYCSDGDGNDDSYVTRLDCTHPNGEGQRMIAVAVIDAIAAIGSEESR